MVLNGAEALAIPTRFGQYLHIQKIQVSSLLIWNSFDETGSCWFKAEINSESLVVVTTSDEQVSEKLIEILQIAKKLNPTFLSNSEGYQVETKLDFPRNWGLGTSSTLINNIAQWAEVNPYQLLDLSFGGSGYDIAAAIHSDPILYRRTDSEPRVNSLHLNWDFTSHLFFVHLNKKKDSKEGIARYRSQSQDENQVLSEIDKLTSEIVTCESLDHFEDLIFQHEAIISEMIQIPTCKSEHFRDYPGAIKSLGAWGGDFILATGPEKNKEYFIQKGYTTILSFEEMIKQ